MTHDELVAEVVNIADAPGSAADVAERVYALADMLRESDALGPCGCIDYHMADCPTRDRGGYSDPPEPDDDYNPDAYDDEED